MSKSDIIKRIEPTQKKPIRMKLKLKALITFAIFLCSFLSLSSAQVGVSSIPAGQTVDLFLRIFTIPGSSTDASHPQWIDCSSFSQEINSTVDPCGGAGSGGGTDTVQSTIGIGDFKIVKAIDKATPKLNLAAVTGQHIGNVTLHVAELAQSSGLQIVFYKVFMTDVVVVSTRQVTNAAVPMEEVSFRYRKITWIFTQIDPVTGRVMGDTKSSWDRCANQGG